MPSGKTHIVGAGLAGLAAALRLSQTGSEVIIHEATDHAGGRCRSYFEPALGLTIDNGNHLVLSGNQSALTFLKTIGAPRGLVGPDAAEFPFADLASPVKADAKGRVRFTGVPMGQHRLMVQGIGAGNYIKEIRYNGLTISDGIFTPIPGAPGQLDIVIDDHAAVAGRVPEAVAR